LPACAAIDVIGPRGGSTIDVNVDLDQAWVRPISAGEGSSPRLWPAADQSEVMMRMLGWMIVGGAMIAAIAPAVAQRYDPRYPVCLQVYEWGGSSHYDCSFTSLEQCRMTASGLSAVCYANPYWSQAREVWPGEQRRRGRGY
jgi:hypothetical protein